MGLVWPQSRRQSGGGEGQRGQRGGGGPGAQDGPLIGRVIDETNIMQWINRNAINYPIQAINQPIHAID